MRARREEEKHYGIMFSLSLALIMCVFGSNKNYFMWSEKEEEDKNDIHLTRLE